MRPAVARDTEALDLTADDFPVRFVGIGATAALLEQASISVECRGQFGGKPFGTIVELRPEAADVGVTVPAEAVLESIRIDALERGGGAKTLHLVMPFAQSTLIDLSSFPEFGSHLVVVEAGLDGGPIGLLAVDLVGEGREDEDGATETIALTDAAPKKEWRYTARSPFRAGYRYRRRADAGQPPRPWSDVQPPDAPLRLTPSMLAGR